MKKVNIAGFDQLPDDALTNVNVVAAIINCGVSTVWRYLALDPDFPKPIRFSKRNTRWRIGDIRAYLASKRVAT